MLGTLMMLQGLFMFLCIGIALLYDEPWGYFALAGGITLTVGIAARSWGIRTRFKEIRKRDGFVIVSFGWLSMGLFGTLPFLFSGAIPNFEDALFETVSGFTTTGATILTDIEALPHAVLFWRSLTHWIGGMGIIVLTIAILPLLGVGGMQLFVAEGSGTSTEKLHPRITETAKRLWVVYVMLTLICMTLLQMAGMGFFDAINHAMSTIATGGFSTRNASVGYFENPAIHWIIIVFMFLGGTNFTLLYLFASGRFGRIRKNEELKKYALFALVTGLIVSLGLYFFYHNDPELSLRTGFFHVMSILTTTGFTTDNYMAWPPFLTFIIFILMFTGASAGSTSGGVKLVRLIILVKNSTLELKRQLHPSAIIPVRLNGRGVPQSIVFNISAFVLLYLLIFFLGALVLAAMGLDFETAIGASIASLGNIGPAIGTVGPMDNFAHLTHEAKTFCAFLMLLGRLELFTVLLLFMPYFWRGR